MAKPKGPSKKRRAVYRRPHSPYLYGAVATASTISPYLTAPNFNAWGTFSNIGNPNAEVQDCTVVAAANLIQAWRAANNQNDSATSVQSDPSVMATYNILSNNQNVGVKMSDLLNFWIRTGFCNNQVLGWGKILCQDKARIQTAIYEYGGCYLGIKLTSYYQSDSETIDPNVPWDQLPPNGAVGNDSPNSPTILLHCVAAIGYDDVNGLTVVSWGAPRPMSWSFLSTYGDEAYAVLDPDWIGGNGSSPTGYTTSTLQQLLSTYNVT